MSRTPPYDELAEESLVGALLVDPSVFDVVAPVLMPDDLYVPRLRVLYATLREMWANGEVIDPVTVSGS